MVVLTPEVVMSHRLWSIKYWAASFSNRGKRSLLLSQSPQKPRGGWKSSVASLKGSSIFPNRAILGCQDEPGGCWTLHHLRLSQSCVTVTLQYTTRFTNTEPPFWRHHYLLCGQSLWRPPRIKAVHWIRGAYDMKG